LVSVLCSEYMLYSEYLMKT